MKKILLVEDEQIIALSQIHTLKKYGYQTLVAENGEKGVTAALEDRDISLILMDIDLGPGIDGTEAARQILSHREVPIVFLTGHTEQSLVDKVRDITRYGYVLKSSGEFVLTQSIEMAYQLFEATMALKQENLERKKNEEKAKQRLEDITFLYEAAQTLVDIESEERIYPFIAEKLQDLNPGAYIVVNSVHYKEGFTRTEAVAGVGKKMEHIFSILGFNPIGAIYRYDESLEQLQSGHLVRFEHGVHELSFKKVPRPIASSIERLLAIEAIYGIGFVSEGELFANTAIIFPKGKKMEKRKTVETFVQQAAIALNRRRKA